MKRAAAAVLLVALASCKGVTPARLDPRDPFGLVVTLETRMGKFRKVELIGCDPRFLFVHERPANRWGRIPWRDVRTNAIYLDRNTSGMGITTLVGSLSTISHGYILVLSLPVWLIGGGVITDSALEQKLTIPVHDGAKACYRLSPYVRFPGGLPPSMRARFGLQP